VEGDTRGMNDTCPTLALGLRRMGWGARFDSSNVICPVNPGSMNPAVEWMIKPNLA
jgi:hypothetical protein